MTTHFIPRISSSEVLNPVIEKRILNLAIKRLGYDIFITRLIRFLGKLEFDGLIIAIEWRRNSK